METKNDQESSDNVNESLTPTEIEDVVIFWNLHIDIRLWKYCRKSTGSFTIMSTCMYRPVVLTFAFLTKLWLRILMLRLHTLGHCLTMSVVDFCFWWEMSSRQLGNCSCGNGFIRVDSENFVSLQYLVHFLWHGILTWVISTHFCRLLWRNFWKLLFE